MTERHRPSKNDGLSGTDKPSARPPLSLVIFLLGFVAVIAYAVIFDE